MVPFMPGSITFLFWVNVVLLVLSITGLFQYQDASLQTYAEAIGFSLWYLIGVIMILTKSRKLFYVYLLSILIYLAGVIVWSVWYFFQLADVLEQRQFLGEQVQLLVSLLFLWFIGTTHRYFSTTSWRFWSNLKGDQ